SSTVPDTGLNQILKAVDGTVRLTTARSVNVLRSIVVQLTPPSVLYLTLPCGLAKRRTDDAFAGIPFALKVAVVSEDETLQI
ncbi:hypothetical protein, partial [Klebsiella pneumoniae]|uniref:hypothetical protein n=1 Tax=Klebsiella pneumoniae TaxID=573 RepID=UPI003EDF512F